MKREKLNCLQEQDLLIGLIRSDKFCRELIPIIKLYHFDLTYSKILFEWIKNYFEEFKSSPKQDIIKLYRANCHLVSDSVLLDNLLNFIEKICEDYENNSFNTEFVLQESIKFLKKQELKNIQKNLESYLLTDDIAKAEELVYGSKALEKVSGKSVSIFNKTAVLNSFEDEENSLFSIKGAFGEVIGDIHREDFISFLAAMKKGKTFTLIEVGVEALRQGLKVLHVSLEMSESQVLKRYWLNLTGRTNKENEEINYSFFVEDSEGKYRIENKKISREKLTVDYVEKKEKSFKRMFRNGEIKIFAVPAYSLTVHSLENELIRLEENEDFIADVLIVDYADIMRPTERADYRQQLDGIWKRLRGLAQSRKMAVITASQSNRNGLVKDSESQDIAEDIRKIAHVTSLVAINQSESEKEKSIVRFKQLAVREGKQLFKQAVCTQCLEIGRMVTDSKFEDEIFGFKEEKSKKQVDNRSLKEYTDKNNKMRGN